MRPGWIIDDLPHPPDPDNIPCKGFGGLFDLDIFDSSETWGGYHVSADRELRYLARPALEVCAGCPLANREWCIRVVDPKRETFTGVAGGLLWRASKVIASIDDVFGIERAA